MIIANLLHMKADQLLYKYERPLKLRYQGRKIIVYPDFTILNTQTGKFTYWETVSNTHLSVEFCHKIGLDYVSCSPFRVPIARLAAAQAAIAEKAAK